jgi:hypothetical protein
VIEVEKAIKRRISIMLVPLHGLTSKLKGLHLIIPLTMELTMEQATLALFCAFVPLERKSNELRPLVDLQSAQ